MLGNNMFAYCLNNPMHYLDEDGEKAAVILPIWDYYYIHRRVQELVSFYYGYAMEVYVRKSDDHFGRLDLYDPIYNQYYEVKSIGAAYTTDTVDQMNSYSNSTIVDWRFIFSENPGSPHRGTNASIQGTFTYSFYTVTYKYVGNGLIVYTVDYNTLAIAAVAVGVAYVACGSFSNLGNMGWADKTRTAMVAK